MDVDLPNPAFLEAIPHGTVVFGLLFQVVFFGVFPECLRVIPWAGSRGPSEDISRGCL